MSWSIQKKIGTPEKIVQFLKEESTKLTGASKEEFDDVLPNLIALVESNSSEDFPRFLEITANGHASFKDVVENGVKMPRKKIYSSCQVEIKNCSASVL